VRYRPPGAKEDVDEPNWLPRGGAVQVGITAGASTPNNKIGDTVARIFATRGVRPEAIL
jgi:4-hydroxy-3-methylbut-2-enyl diphosphate reductase